MNELTFNFLAILCGTLTALPAVEADFCAPDFNLGQLKYLYFTNAGEGLTDVTDPVEWGLRLDQSGAATDAIRTLHIIGDKPAPEVTNVELSLGREASTEKKHTYNIIIDETNQTNYAFLQELENNPRTFTVWLEGSKYIYGGNDGIAATILINDIIPQADTELNTFVGTITFKGNHPNRDLSPF